ncbi:MAG TPA: HAD family hydrolase [Methylomirabilota bacterium]|jgi:putative hydrolase of the HAD superfamily
MAASSGRAAVLFDFGGTLDADGVTWKERVGRLYRDEGVDVGGASFDRLFYAADDALVGKIERTLSFQETVSRLTAGVARGLGLLDDALAERVAARFVDDARATLRRNAGVLATLSARYRFAIVSNFYGNLARVCGDGGLGGLFDVIVDSTDVGVCKPDPAIFRVALERLGVSPADAVFVGDSAPRDMAGARAAGLAHVWLVADGADRAVPCCPGDRVIGSLKDLPGVLA